MSTIMLNPTTTSIIDSLTSAIGLPAEVTTVTKIQIKTPTGFLVAEVTVSQDREGGETVTSSDSIKSLLPDLSAVPSPRARAGVAIEPVGVSSVEPEKDTVPAEVEPEEEVLDLTPHLTAEEHALLFEGVRFKVPDDDAAEAIDRKIAAARAKHEHYLRELSATVEPVVAEEPELPPLNITTTPHRTALNEANLCRFFDNLTHQVDEDADYDVWVLGRLGTCWEFQTKEEALQLAFDHACKGSANPTARLMLEKRCDPANPRFNHDYRIHKDGNRDYRVTRWGIDVARVEGDLSYAREVAKHHLHTGVVQSGSQVKKLYGLDPWRAWAA